MRTHTLGQLREMSVSINGFDASNVAPTGILGGNLQLDATGIAHNSCALVYVDSVSSRAYGNPGRRPADAPGARIALAPCASGNYEFRTLVRMWRAGSKAGAEEVGILAELGPRRGYLIPEFPGQTHSFFWREIQALQVPHGHPVRILADRVTLLGAVAQQEVLDQLHAPDGFELASWAEPQRRRSERSAARFRLITVIPEKGRFPVGSCVAAVMGFGANICSYPRAGLSQGMTGLER